MVGVTTIQYINRSIQARLLVLSGLFFGILAGALSFALISIESVEDMAESLNLNSLPAARILDDASVQLAHLRAAEATLLPGKASPEFAQVQGQLRQLQNAYSTLDVSDDERSLAGTFDKALKAYVDAYNAWTADRLPAQAEQAADESERLPRLGQAATSALSALKSAAVAQAKSNADAAEKTAEITLDLMVGLGAIGLILTAGIIWHLKKRLSDPLVSITRGLASLAGGRTDIAVPEFDRSDEIGALAKAFQVFRESTMARQRAEASLAEQNRRFDAALVNLPHGMCMFDAQERLILCNAQYSRMYDLPADLIAPGTPLDRILDYRASVGNGPADPATYFDVVVLAQSKGTIASTKIDMTDGRTIRITHNPMADGGYVATHEDVTESVRAEAKIAHMAGHDALTGLPNRYLLHEKIAEILVRAAYNEQVAVLCLDLDQFKIVNDTLGHPIGDLLLKAVADRLRGCVPEADILARLGGDEFVIVQANTGWPEQIEALARNITDNVSQPFDLDGHQVVVSTSIGVALGPDDAADADRLLKNADMALYRAKADGRGTYRFFEAEMDARAQQRRQLELDLRRGLVSNEFRLYYQPVVDTQTRKIIGFEALLRWMHPDRGIVSPAEFIPLAEEIGAIIPLGEWVIRQACADAATWSKDVKVAVNLSAVQFKSRTLVHKVASALADSGLSPQRLEMEITESVLLANSEATLAALYDLKRLGVRIAMDDFGTGYSSLSYLRSFPFDKIKIDRSFVMELGTRDGASAIVRTVANLGASLGMITTAEGVETAEQFAQVREEGCTEVQGYYFSPPRPAGEVMEMLERELASAA